jgi:hypothetical protein
MMTCTRCPDGADGLRGPARLMVRPACLAAFYLACGQVMSNAGKRRGVSMVGFSWTQPWCPISCVSARDPRPPVMCDRRRANVSLGVEPQDVIAGHAEPADGYFIIGANMRPVPVVAAEPDRQLCLGLASVWIGVRVSPLA